MKTARFLLACAAASLLAACGTDPITAPATDRAVPNARPGDTTVCVKTVVVNPDGTTKEVCVYSSGGPQIGSGS